MVFHCIYNLNLPNDQWTLSIFTCIYESDTYILFGKGIFKSFACLLDTSACQFASVMDRLVCPWESPGQNTGVGCHPLLQGIFPTQGSNLCLLVSCIGFFTTSATWELPLVGFVLCKYFLPVCGLFFNFSKCTYLLESKVSLLCCGLILMRSNLVIFFIIVSAFCIIFRKSLPNLGH